MTRAEQHTHNQKVIAVLSGQMGSSYCSPSYSTLVGLLNDRGLFTSRGNPWTSKSLFRMLQRNGYSGLWGLHQSIRH